MFDVDHKFPDYFTLKQVVILIRCAIKDDAKLYPQIFLEEALCNKYEQRKVLKKNKEIINAYGMSS